MKKSPLNDDPFETEQKSEAPVAARAAGALPSWPPLWPPAPRVGHVGPQG